MTTWEISDGTTVARGGKVTGSSDFAEDLREQLGEELLEQRVDVGPEPGGDVALDPKNDYLLHLWITRQARLSGLTLTTTYEPRLIDAPRSVQRLVNELSSAEHVDGAGRQRIF